MTELNESDRLEDEQLSGQNENQHLPVNHWRFFYVLVASPIVPLPASAVYSHWAQDKTIAWKMIPFFPLQITLWVLFLLYGGFGILWRMLKSVTPFRSPALCPA